MLKTAIVVQPKPRRGSSITSLTKPREGHHAITSQHSGRPQSHKVKVSKNEVPDNDPERRCGHSTSAGRKYRWGIMGIYMSYFASFRLPRGHCPAIEKPDRGNCPLLSSRHVLGGTHPG